MLISNNGPLILDTDYWRSEVNMAGGFMLSPNDGVLRLLVPSGWGWEQEFLRNTYGAREVLVSCGPLPVERGIEGIELLWKDGLIDQFCLHLYAHQCVPLIDSTYQGRSIPLTIWTRKQGKPHLACEFSARFRMVEKIPWLKDWE